MKPREKKLYIYVFVILLIMTALIWYVVLDFKNRERFLTVAFIDVGQGDAIFIEAPNGNQILIDGGANRKVLEGLGQVMPFYDLSLNTIIATHPDSDHIGGLVPVFEKYKVERFITNPTTKETNIIDTLENTVENEQADIVTVKTGDKIYLDPVKNIYLEVLHPSTDFSAEDSNDHSIVFILYYEQSQYLLTGDAPKSVELNILKEYPDLEVDVLKVGHHGSNTSTAEELLSSTTPQMAIISAEADSRYGHPHQEVVDVLNKYEIEILETKNLGTIITRSNGENIWIEK